MLFRSRLGEAWALKGRGDATAGTQPVAAKVDLTVAAAIFQSLGMDARRTEATAAAAAISR